MFQEACKAVKDENMSEAARKYSVPVETLHRRILLAL